MKLEDVLARMLRTDVLMHATARPVIQTNTPGMSVDGAELRRRLVEGSLATPEGKALSALVEAADRAVVAYGSDDEWDAMAVLALARTAFLALGDGS